LIDSLLTQNLGTPNFPHPMLSQPDGLNSITPHLRLSQLIFAYRMGIFPWYNGDSFIAMWHFPPERMLLLPENIKIAKSMRTYFNNDTYSCTINQNFVNVMKACRETRHDHPEESWIHYAMENAFFELHKMGLAHSIEVWDQKQEMVGGLYGVGMGHIFTGESMFHLKRDASKFALISLAKILQKLPGSIIDCQLYTPHLESMGAHLESAPAFWNLIRYNFQQPLRTIQNHFKAITAV